jgi:hypothetical protein
MNNYIVILIIEYNFNLFKILYKILFLDYYIFIKIYIINILNLILDFKYLLYFKFNINDFLQYFYKYIQNIKNKILYFKSNYYYFKKQKLVRRRKKRVPLMSLLSTNLKRN